MKKKSGNGELAEKAICKEKDDMHAVTKNVFSVKKKVYGADVGLCDCSTCCSPFFRRKKPGSKKKIS